MKKLSPSKKSYLCVNFFGFTILAVFIADAHHIMGNGIGFISSTVFLVLFYSLVAYFFATSYVKIDVSGLEQRLLVFTETVPLALISAVETTKPRSVMLLKTDGTVFKIEMDMWADSAGRKEFITELENLIKQRR